MIYTNPIYSCKDKASHNNLILHHYTLEEDQRRCAYEPAVKPYRVALFCNTTKVREMTVESEALWALLDLSPLMSYEP